MKTHKVSYSEVKHLFRYINQIYTCASFADMLALKLFPDAKEITESCAAFEVIFHKTSIFKLSDRDVTLISVGDGTTPRTAAMFAYRSAFNCISIDPRLNKAKIPYWEANIKRLKCYPTRVEEVPKMSFGKLIIVAVHSHANLEIADCRFKAKEKIVIAIPCCVKQEIGRQPDIEYADAGIWSPCNKVKIWF